jgi:hypothetical protein
MSGWIDWVLTNWPELSTENPPVSTHVPQFQFEHEFRDEKLMKTKDHLVPPKPPRQRGPFGDRRTTRGRFPR